MKIDLLARPSMTTADIYLNAGETITAEVGAMIGVSSKIDVTTTTRSISGKGGFFKGLKRMVSGENFFLNHFTSTVDEQRLLIAPVLVGDIVIHNLKNSTPLIVQGSSWLASSGGVDMDTNWQGFGSALLSGESMFWLKLTGEGVALINSFGGIYQVDVDGEYVVDTGHIVAFEDSLQFNISKSSSSWLGSFFSGEGIVCRFKGKGRLYCQTHNPPTFGRTLGSMLKPREDRS